MMKGNRAQLILLTRAAAQSQCGGAGILSMIRTTGPGLLPLACVVIAMQRSNAGSER